MTRGFYATSPASRLVFVGPLLGHPKYHSSSSLHRFRDFLPYFLGLRDHRLLLGLSEDVQSPFHLLQATMHPFQLLWTNSFLLHALAALFQKPDCLLQRRREAT